MIGKKLPIPKNRLLIMLCFNIGVLIYGVITKIYNLDFSDFLYGAAVTVFLVTWIIVLVDIIRNKVYNKIFWLLSMFIIPHISSLFYIIQREKLIRLGDKF